MNFDPWSLPLSELVGHQRAEFARASVLRSWLIACQFAIAVPGAASVLVEDGMALYFLAAAGAALLFTWLHLDRRYRAHRHVGERARRATLIMQGLGQQVSPEEMFDLRNSFKVSAVQAKPYEDKAYFSSSAPPGLRRLGEMLEESAFWSETLQTDSAKAMGALFAFLLVLGLVAVLALVPFADRPTIMAALRIGLAMLVFLLSSDVLAAWRSHEQAARQIRDIQTRLRVAASSGYPQADVLLLMSEYNAAVEAAPVVVPFVYKLKQGALNDRWSRYLMERNARVPIAKGPIAAARSAP
jgi:hypothetical protein